MCFAFGSWSRVQSLRARARVECFAFGSWSFSVVPSWLSLVLVPAWLGALLFYGCAASQAYAFARVSTYSHPKMSVAIVASVFNVTQYFGANLGVEWFYICELINHLSQACSFLFMGGRVDITEAARDTDFQEFLQSYWVARKSARRRLLRRAAQESPYIIDRLYRDLDTPEGEGSKTLPKAYHNSFEYWKQHGTLPYPFP